MPRGTGGAPRGSMETRIDAMMVHSIVLRRAGSNQTAQSMYLDFTAAGAEALGAGVTGGAVGVAVYVKDDASVQAGDVFAHGGTQYTVEFVSPKGNHLIGGESYRICWARGKQ